MALGFLVGVYVYIQTKSSEGEPEFLKLRIANVVPSIAWGYNMMEWLMSETK